MAKLFCVLSMSFCLLAIRAQGQAAAPAAASGGTVSAVVGSVGLFSNVKNHPFSADIVDENIQFLVDGNRIHSESHGKIFRDAEGRLRQENEVAAGLQYISIQDPLQKIVISLDSQKKIATIHHYEPVQWAEPAPNRPNLATEAKPASNSGSGNIRAGLQTPSANGNKSSGSMAPQIAGMRVAAGNAVAVKPPWNEESLGRGDIEGFSVIGTRRTQTTPAGAMGNDKPITSTSDRWYSPELQAELLMKTDSPFGSYVHKLVNIRTGDPDPLLFQVPTEYAVQEAPQP
jgi:hypothetical protein